MTTKSEDLIICRVTVNTKAEQGTLKQGWIYWFDPADPWVKRNMSGTNPVLVREPDLEAEADALDEAEAEPEVEVESEPAAEVESEDAAEAQKVADLIGSWRDADDDGA